LRAAAPAAPCSVPLPSSASALTSIPASGLEATFIRTLRAGCASRKVCPLPSPLPQTGEGTGDHRTFVPRQRWFGSPLLCLANVGSSLHFCASPTLVRVSTFVPRQRWFGSPLLCLANVGSGLHFCASPTLIQAPFLCVSNVDSVSTTSRTVSFIGPPATSWSRARGGVFLLRGPRGALLPVRRQVASAERSGPRAAGRTFVPRTLARVHRFYPARVLPAQPAA
jgi:hypothetical protein